MTRAPFGYFVYSNFGWTPVGQCHPDGVPFYQQGDIDELEADKDELLEALKEMKDANNIPLCSRQSNPLKRCMCIYCVRDRCNKLIANMGVTK